MSNMDKMIKANFKMIDNHLAGACAIIIFSLVFIWVALFFGVLLLAALAGVAYLTYKIVYILFYDSLFGRNALFYRTLPVTAEETVLSRIYVAVMSVLIMDGFMLGGILFVTTGLAGWSLDRSGIENLVSSLSELLSIGVDAYFSITLAVLLLSSILITTTNFAVIFWAVCYYETLPVEKKNGATKATVSLAAGAFYMLGTSVAPFVLGLVGVESSLIPNLLNMIIMAMVLVTAVKKTVKLVDGVTNVT